MLMSIHIIPRNTHVAEHLVNLYLQIVGVLAGAFWRIKSYWCCWHQSSFLFFELQ